MVTVWLYSADGRALYCVYVPTPMPLVINFAGKSFARSAANHRYEEVAAPYLATPVPPEHQPTSP